MSGPAWLSGTLAAVMIVVSGYCLARLGISVLRHRPTDRGVDAVHVLMGVAMVGMFVPSLRVLRAGGWEVVFAAGIVWFGIRWLGSLSGRSQKGRVPWHHLHHAVGCAAMVYMLAAAVSAARAGHGARAMGGTGIPLPALVLAIALLAFVISTVDRISSLAPVAAYSLATRPGPPGWRSAGAGAHPSPAGVRPELASGASGPAIPDAPAPARLPAPASASCGAPLSPRLAACCDIVMGLAMGYMLILVH